MTVVESGGGGPVGWKRDKHMHYMYAQHLRHACLEVSYIALVFSYDSKNKEEHRL